MPNVNIYLPDDLAESVATAKDRLNVSFICQRALREEIAVLKTTEETEFERIEVDTEDRATHIIRTVRFNGRWLSEPNRLYPETDGFVYGVALTARGRIAIWRYVDDGGSERFGEFFHFHTLEEAEAHAAFGEAFPAEVIADARAVLTGDVSVLDLDI